MASATCPKCSREFATQQRCNMHALSCKSGKAPAAGAQAAEPQAKGKQAKAAKAPAAGAEDASEGAGFNPNPLA